MSHKIPVVVAWYPRWINSISAVFQRSSYSFPRAEGRVLNHYQWVARIIKATQQRIRPPNHNLDRCYCSIRYLRVTVSDISKKGGVFDHSFRAAFSRKLIIENLLLIKIAFHTTLAGRGNVALIVVAATLIYDLSWPSIRDAASAPLQHLSRSLQTHGCA